MYAPIIIFAFNRPNALKNTVLSLLENKESKDSDLFIFVDGARANKPNEKENVAKVQEYVKSITGFKHIETFFSPTNKGLGNSIIQGVTTVIGKYGKAIVLEDDLVFSPNFLAFMNEGLNRYETEQKVFSICGYSNKVSPPKDYPYDAYFCTRSSSWGWATWQDRWKTIDWELKNWDKYSQMKKAFNKWGGSDCYGMLLSVKEGWGDSWAIRFGFSEFLQDKVSLFPITSKVKNDGFNGQGTNCKKWSRFKYEFDEDGDEEFKLTSHISLNKKLYRSAMSYHSIMIRLWSRIMYIIH